MKKQRPRGSWLFTVPNDAEGVAWLRQMGKYKAKGFRLKARGRGHRGSGDEAIPCTTWNRDLPIEHAERIVVYIEYGDERTNPTTYSFQMGVRAAEDRCHETIAELREKCAIANKMLDAQGEYIQKQDEQIKAQGKTIESLMRYDCRTLNNELARLVEAKMQLERDTHKARFELDKQIVSLKKRLSERASVEQTLERSEHGEREASQTPE